MESKRLLAILNELDANLIELEQRQSAAQITFQSLETLIDYHKSLQELANEREILEKIRPQLIQTIEQQVQQEQAAMSQHKLAAGSKEIKKTVTRLQKTENCSVEQAQALLQLTKLKNGGN